MKLKEFIDANNEVWSYYFKSISDGSIKLELHGDKKNILFPNIILFTQTDDHFILELFGADSIFNGLTSKVNNTNSSLLTYLYQFDHKDDSPLIHLNGRRICIDDLIISNKVDCDELRKRFSFYVPRSGGLQSDDICGTLFSFGDELLSIFMNNCILINRSGNIYRIKHISHMVIVSKQLALQDYKYDLISRLNMSKVCGIHFYRDQTDEGYLLAGQFANLFLLPGLRETTIGEFLNNNSNFTKRAFSCMDYIYEPELSWVEGNPYSDETSINPDLMIKRKDGYFDICELKTPLLNKKSVTKGRHKRRGFIEHVNVGLTQLANYEDYFKFKKNKLLAKSKYGIDVKDPNLILVVGSYENASKDEINEAARMLKPNYRIIDYDTLNAIFLQSMI